MLKKLIDYSLESYIHPFRAARKLSGDPDSVRLGLAMTVVFGAMYSFTAMLLYARRIRPVLKPLLPIKEERYYLWQAFFTIPWAVAEWLLAGCAVRSLNKPSAEKGDAGELMGPLAFANCLPWVAFTWLPETTLIPALRRIPWPEGVEKARVAAPILWMFALGAVACREACGASWARALGSSAVSTAIMGAMFMVFLR